MSTQRVALPASEVRSAELLVNSFQSGEICARLRVPGSDQAMAEALADKALCSFVRTAVRCFLRIGNSYFAVSTSEAAEIAQAFGIRWQS